MTSTENAESAEVHRWKAFSFLPFQLCGSLRSLRLIFFLAGLSRRRRRMKDSAKKDRSW